MKRLSVCCETETAQDSRNIDIRELVVAGWTGRDPDAVEAHIRELDALGVARPKSTPIFYRVANSQLTTKSEIQVAGRGGTGEVECVIIRLEDGFWVGVGSDHTDRELETTSVTLSKQVCAKPMGTVLWRYDELADYWDDLQLESFATINGQRRRYQSGTVASMLKPKQLIDLYTSSDIEVGTAMFCGTLPVLGEIEFATRFEIVLSDPHRHRAISHVYDITALPMEG